jgi:hypothetical protein
MARFIAGGIWGEVFDVGAPSFEYCFHITRIGESDHSPSGKTFNPKEIHVFESFSFVDGFSIVNQPFTGLPSKCAPSQP